MDVAGRGPVDVGGNHHPGIDVGVTHALLRGHDGIAISPYVGNLADDDRQIRYAEILANARNKTGQQVFVVGGHTGAETGFVLWNYVSDYPGDMTRGIQDFTISFATDSEGVSGFGTSIADTSTYTATIGADLLPSDPDNSGICGQVFDFTDVTARYLRVNIANNYGSTQFIGATEMRVSKVTEQRIPGDANGDEKVDAADVSIMAANWGVGNATWEMGDFSKNGTVGKEDAKLLAQNWGTGVVGSDVATVPEPSALVLLLTLPLMLLSRQI